MINKVCVLIRVYNRIEDLRYCLSIIRDTWKLNNYYVIVVFNGSEDGYTLEQESADKIDKLICIKNNIGHFSGNSQLLLAGLPHISANCDYTIILEADTWIYGDGLINNYIAKLDEQNAVWASAQFFRYVLNLATDFAIVKTSFIKSNPDIFKFERTPEYYVANYLKDNGYRFIYIKENMPVNLPRYIKKYPFALTGRFFLFPAGKMVTHHVETLKGGMEEKKFYFNLVTGTKYFDVPDIWPIYLTKLALNLCVVLSVVIPYKGWFIHRKDQY